MDLLTELAILVLAAFVGFEVISKVPNTLHTPLMSGTNAIHGIVVLGGLLLIGPADGLLVTDRMLGMFKNKPAPADAGASGSEKPDPVVEGGEETKQLP